MLIGEFTRFLQRNVIPYDRPDLPINFVGGVANNFDSGKVFKNEVCIASFNWWNPNNLSITCENIGLNEQVSVLEAVNVFISDVKGTVSE